jgi:hypothetical protein
MPIKPLSQRFEEHHITVPECGCWLWTGSLMPKGYGFLVVKRNKKMHTISAHRLSWQLHLGEIPAGLNVLHKCDVRCCVNPNHLFLGTSKDNTQDMINKGREGFSGPKPDMQGEKHFASKLTEEDVILIRGSSRSAAGIARNLGVSAGAVLSVRNGRTWSWFRPTA